MTYNEYVEAINKVLAEPDTALVNIQTVTDELKTDLETFATVTAENEKLNQRIRDLQDTNMKLFLQTGGKAEQHEDEEDEATKIDEMSFDEYINYLKESEGDENE